MKQPLDREGLVMLLIQQAARLGIQQLDAYPGGSSYSFAIRCQGRSYHALILMRSSDYWEKRIHMGKDAPDLLIVWLHDSCVPVAVLALRTGDWDQPYSHAQVTQRNRYTARIIVGQLLCGLQAAYDEIAQFPEGTRYRYLAKVAALSKRKRGRPLKV